jgi:hypothetical protein
MAAWDELETADKQSIQAGVVKDSIVGNPLLPNGAGANNYQFTVEADNLAQAVNVLQEQVDGAITSLTETLVTSESVIGNRFHHPEAYNTIVENGGNVLQATANLIVEHEW